MTTLNLDDLLSMDPEELEQENARNNRPTWNKDPVVFEGDFQKGLVPAQDVSEKTGQVFDRLGAVFKNVKFVDVGNGVGLYTDGQDYILKLRNPQEELAQNSKMRKPMTQVGRSTEASGADLTTFMGSRVRVTELAREWKTTEGYTRQSYYYKFEKIGDGGQNGTAPAIPEELVNAALQVIAGNQFTRTNVGMGLMKSPSCNTSATLNGKFADGSFIKEMLDAGRVKEVDGVLTV